MSSVVTMYGMKELAEDRVSEFKVDWLDPKLNIGIEIEVEREGDTEIDTDLNMWTTKADGSLRRGTEFVLSRPLKGDALSAAIEEFFQRNIVYRSPTSGTHIHVDMRDKEATLDVVKTMTAIIVCIEPAIFGMFAEGREWSGYTNPLTSLPDLAGYSMFSELAGPSDFVDTFSPNTREYKYYGFNVLPLGRYGSVEFRYFPTAESAEELIEWTQFCMAVKIAAVQLNLRANLKYYISSEMAWEEFLNKFFTQWRDQMLAFLPQKEVYARYRQARSRLTRGINMGKAKLTVGGRATPMANPFNDTRFKKFFAIKMKTEEGKNKVVYDLETVTALTPTRVFFDTDRCINSYDLEKRDGDWLLSGSILWRFSVEHNRWREVIYYNLATSRNNDRITDEYMGMSAADVATFGRGVQARITGATMGLDVADLSAASSGAGTQRSKLERIMVLVTARYASAPAPEPEVLVQEVDDVRPPAPPRDYVFGNGHFDQMEEAIRRAQANIAAMQAAPTGAGRNPR